MEINTLMLLIGPLAFSYLDVLNMLVSGPSAKRVFEHIVDACTSWKYR